MTTELVKIHETDIECPFAKGQQYVTVESICAYLGIEAEPQIDMIKHDPILKRVYIPDLMSSPGKGQPKKKMFCIPLKFVFGFMFTVDSNLIPVEKRKDWHTVKLDCYNNLYDHFYMKTALYEAKEKKLVNVHDRIIRAMEDISDKRDILKKLRNEYDLIAKTPVGQLQLELNEN